MRPNVLVSEVEAYGHIPNCNGPHAVCSSRSQSPFLTSAIRKVYPSINDRSWLERAASAAAAEYHGCWMAAPHITVTGLSRHIDLGGNGCETVPLSRLPSTCPVTCGRTEWHGLNLPRSHSLQPDRSALQEANHKL
jgi:hypothetical protein